MQRHGMTDIDGLIAQVWSPESRALAEEAWDCYNAGAMRGSIAVTWAAVLADIIAKISHLADSGEGDAVHVIESVEDAQNHGLSAQGVRAMQQIEYSLLDKAASLELIDEIDKRELDRIGQDRNLCVHQSLRPFGETYLPSAEVARAHLTTALRTLLARRPAQGRKLVEAYRDWLCSPAFAPNDSHIRAAYVERVRPATLRNLVALTAKHALF
jgi:hypothetical protein